MKERRLGSPGTPLSSIILPMPFNLVTSGVAEKLSEITDVRHTIYADDITVCVKGNPTATCSQRCKKRSTHSRATYRTRNSDVRPRHPSY